MLHEYRDEISVLKQENAHFAKIFDEHNELDQKIPRAPGCARPGCGHPVFRRLDLQKAEIRNKNRTIYF